MVFSHPAYEALSIEFDEARVEIRELNETLRDKDKWIQWLKARLEAAEGENAKLRNDNERPKRKRINASSDSDMGPMGSDSDNS